MNLQTTEEGLTIRQVFFFTEGRKLFAIRIVRKISLVKQHYDHKISDTTLTQPSAESTGAHAAIQYKLIRSHRLFSVQ